MESVRLGPVSPATVVLAEARRWLREGRRTDAELHAEDGTTAIRCAWEEKALLDANLFLLDPGATA